MDYVFEWERILFNKLPAHFLFEVILRSVVMFVLLLVVLKLTGKRGVKQLSVFEMVIVISLGSAAGDPMFYEDVGLVPAIVVFIIVLLLYRFVTWLTGKSVWFEQLVEGKTECLIDEGKFSAVKFEQESLSHDEFFTELRLKSIEHLGQIRKAYIETTGDISVFYYSDEEVKPGLPICPELFNAKSKHIPKPGLHACSFCADVVKHENNIAICKICGNDEWVPAIDTKRIK